MTLVYKAKAVLVCDMYRCHFAKHGNHRLKMHGVSSWRN